MASSPPMRASPRVAKRFAAIGIPSTAETRRAYRDMLISAVGIGESISGVILFDETIRQSTSGGVPISEYLAAHGVLPGIKVDRGAEQLAGFPGERVTEGLDGLRDRLAEYRALGARFAKWRAVIAVDAALPSRACLLANAHALARYAAMCQESGIVPIVEAEVLMDGDHTLGRCFEVTEALLRAVFDELAIQRVALELHGPQIEHGAPRNLVHSEGDSSDHRRGHHCVSSANGASGSSRRRLSLRRTGADRGNRTPQCYGGAGASPMAAYLLVRSRSPGGRAPHLAGQGVKRCCGSADLSSPGEMQRSGIGWRVLRRLGSRTTGWTSGSLNTRWELHAGRQCSGQGGRDQRDRGADSAAFRRTRARRLWCDPDNQVTPPPLLSAVAGLSHEVRIRGARDRNIAARDQRIPSVPPVHRTRAHRSGRPRSAVRPPAGSRTSRRN